MNEAKYSPVLNCDPVNETAAAIADDPMYQPGAPQPGGASASFPGIDAVPADISAEARHVDGDSATMMLSTAVTSPPPSVLDPPEDAPPWFSEALIVVERDCALDSEVLRRIRSDLDIAAKVIGQPLDQLPCDPLLLRPLLRRVLPARVGIKPKRWSSIKSSLARVLKLTGWHEREEALSFPITGAWKTARDLLPKSPQKAVFAHFARYCLRARITPEQVSDDTVAQYRHWRERRTLELDPLHGTSSFRRQWNHIVKRDPTWPQVTLRGERNPNRYVLPREAFPASLVAEIDAYCAGMGKRVLLDPQHARSYSATTISCTRGILLRAASVLISKGKPVHELQCLRDILTPESVRIVVLALAERLRGGAELPPSAATVVTTLKRAAKAVGGLSDRELKELEDICRIVRCPSNGLSRRVRERLAQFDEEAILKDLLDLAWDCFETADKMKDRAPAKAARLHQVALALAILINKPLRRANLAAITLDTDVRRDSKGKIVGLKISGEKTKNGRDIEAVFEPKLIWRIDRHLKVYRQILCKGESRHLFPGEVDGHRSPQTMARDLKRLVQSKVGIEFNVHLMRHLCVTLLLEADPTNMPVAQRMLDHGSLKTTERCYGQAPGRGAHRIWGETLVQRLKQAPRRRKP